MNISQGFSLLTLSALFFTGTACSPQKPESREPPLRARGERKKEMLNYSEISALQVSLRDFKGNEQEREFLATVLRDYRVLKDFELNVSVWLGGGPKPLPEKDYVLEVLKIAEDAVPYYRAQSQFLLSERFEALAKYLKNPRVLSECEEFGMPLAIPAPWEANRLAMRVSEMLIEDHLAAQLDTLSKTNITR